MRSVKKAMITGVPVLIAAILTAGVTLYIHRERGDSRAGTEAGRGDGTCVNTGSHGTVNCTILPSPGAGAAPDGSGRCGPPTGRYLAGRAAWADPPGAPLVVRISAPTGHSGGIRPRPAPA